MLKVCVNHVRGLVTNYVKLGKLSSLYTEGSNYLTSQVILMLRFRTLFAHDKAFSAQLKPVHFNPSYVFLYSYSTPPTNKAII